MADTQVVLIHGSRQGGKTTQTRMVDDPTGCDDTIFGDDSQLVAAQIHAGICGLIQDK